MRNRTSVLAVAIAGVFLLGACGGDSDEGATTTTAVAAAATDVPATTTSVADDAPTTTEAAVADEASAELPCGGELTVDEVDAILGTSAEMKGVPSNCLIVFADDAVGSYSRWTGATADEALQVNLDSFNTGSKGAGTLLDDGRGYVAESQLVVRGDSGAVYSLNIPDNLDLADTEVAMSAFLDLLIAR